MNVLVIPSWYPSKSHFLPGIFIKEQLEALAGIAEDCRVYVSLPPAYEGQVTPLRPFSVFRALSWYAQSEKNVTMEELNRVYEVAHPSMSWSSRFGGMRWLTGYHRRNLEFVLRQAGKVDVLHAHVSFPCGYVASVLSEKYRIPYVLTEHMGPFPFPHYMSGGKPRKEISQAFNHAAEAIAVSPSLAARITSFGYRRPVVIPNVIDERRFAIRKERPAGRFVFFTLAGISYEKGIDTLLAAIAAWDPPAEAVAFHIGGGGKKLSFYKTMAGKLGIADRISWLGPIPRQEAPRRFQEADVFVLPSRHESFGVVYAEAIASGLPVIATRCGGPEYIVNEMNGKLVDTGDAQGLANAMREVYGDHQSFSPDRIREDFMRRFSRQAVIPQLTEVYRRVINEQA